MALIDLPEEKRDRIERFLEVLVIIAALGTIPLTYYQARGVEGTLITVGDWGVWIVFAVEYLMMMAIVQNRWSYTRQNWLMVIIILLTFPFMPHLLNLARLVRLVRLIRLVRLLRLTLVTTRGIRALRVVLGRQEVLFVTAVSIIVVLAGGAGFALIEPELADDGIVDGLWWAIVTATTVGYGDIAPESGAGRILGVILMLLGIGIVGTLAASVAAYFVGQDDSEGTAAISERLDKIEETQAQIVANQERLEELMRGRHVRSGVSSDGR